MIENTKIQVPNKEEEIGKKSKSNYSYSSRKIPSKITALISRALVFSSYK
jgi:hypothetical protein